MKKIFYSTLAIILTFTSTAKALKKPEIKFGADDTITNKTVDNFTKLFIDYVEYFINLFWVLTVVFGIFAAFKYLTAKGDPKAAESAKGMVKYTVIAACVALLATVVKEIAKSILGG